MKTFKYFLSIVLFVAAVVSCTEDEFGSVDFTSTVTAPANLAVLFDVTPDNTGLVTITPNSEGAISYSLTFGDETADPVTVKQGENVQHIYAEGNYEVKIVATGITGLTAELSKSLEVSFNAPKNLDVVVENDPAISKQVNVTVNADFAISFDVYFGEEGTDEPVTANIGEAASYGYAEPGLYTIRVVVKGAAIETTEYIVEDFEVTEILQPLVAAPAPFTRAAVDVISMYSEKYEQTTVDMFVTDWSAVTLQEEVAIEGNQTLVYRELNYAGIITEAEPMDASEMEYFHFDVWSTDVTTFKTKFVDFNGTGYNNGTDNIEFELEHSITEEGKWIQFDIPLSEFVGVPFTDINQMVIAAAPVGTVFLDNMYFWREATTAPTGGLFPFDFESKFDLSSFDGGDISVVDNPDTNGNSSTKVAQLIKDAGQPWAGSKITVSSPFEIAESMTVTAKVWSPRAGLNLLMKFEDNVGWPDTSATDEITATTSAANAWEELTFTITGVNTNLEYFNLVLIMDNGTEGDGTADYTIFIDDISVASFLDFEPKFELSSFDGGDISVVDNPDTSGNSSAKVAQLIKDAGQPWAGSKITVNTPFEIAESVTITAKVWSPRAGLNLLMKFEDNVGWPDTSATDEITATTTVGNAWEELTFTLTGVDASVEYYNIVLIMDNGTEGDGTADYTIFVDDIAKN